MSDVIVCKPSTFFAINDSVGDIGQVVVVVQGDTHIKSRDRSFIFWPVVVQVRGLDFGWTVMQRHIESVLGARIILAASVLSARIGVREFFATGVQQRSTRCCEIQDCAKCAKTGMSIPRGTRTTSLEGAIGGLSMKVDGPYVFFRAGRT